MTYLVSYDLKSPGSDYNGLFTALKSLGTWWHYLESTWLIDTTLSADGIRERLKPHIDKNDLVLIIGVTNDFSGYLPKEAWDWIRARKLRVA